MFLTCWDIVGSPASNAGGGDMRPTRDFHGPLLAMHRAVHPRR